MDAAGDVYSVRVCCTEGLRQSKQCIRTNGNVTQTTGEMQMVGAAGVTPSAYTTTWYFHIKDFPRMVLFDWNQIYNQSRGSIPVSPLRATRNYTFVLPQEWLA